MKNLKGGFLATSEDIQGLIAQGRTIAETMEIAQDVARKLIDSAIEHGDNFRLKPNHDRFIGNVKIP